MKGASPIGGAPLLLGGPCDQGAQVPVRASSYRPKSELRSGTMISYAKGEPVDRSPPRAREGTSMVWIRRLVPSLLVVLGSLLLTLATPQVAQAQDSWQYHMA